MLIWWLQGLETCTFALSVSLYVSITKQKLGAFILLTLLAAVTDIIARSLIFAGWKNNYFVYNYYLLVYTPLLLLGFYPILNYRGTLKNLYIGIGGAVCLAVTLNFCFVQGHADFNTYSEVLTTFMAVVLSMLVISNLFTDDDTNLGLTHNPYFWIAAGTLIFSMGSMFVLGLQQFIAARNIQLMGVNIYKVIMPILNIFLYGSYCYSFILCKRLTNKQ